RENGTMIACDVAESVSVTFTEFVTVAGPPFGMPESVPVPELMLMPLCRPVADHSGEPTSPLGSRANGAQLAPPPAFGRLNCERICSGDTTSVELRSMKLLGSAASSTRMVNGKLPDCLSTPMRPEVAPKPLGSGAPFWTRMPGTVFEPGASEKM